LRLFIDSGPLVAYYSIRDKYHATAVKSFETIFAGASAYGRLFVSDYVFDEALTTLRTRTRNHNVSVRMGTEILTAHSFSLLKVDDEVFRSSWELYKSTDDLALSFTDCTIHTLVSKYGIHTVFSYDQELYALGLPTVNHIG
jgi:predicted nucleic acid-binding protein